MADRDTAWLSLVAEIGNLQSMCYTLYLSTDGQLDLTKHNSDLVRFEPISNNDEKPVVMLLKNPNKWYVGSKSGCSCTFRHLKSTELGFGEPEDWYREDQDEINATKELFLLIEQLIFCEHQVDCIDIWEGSDPENVVKMNVQLSLLSEVSFRFFENHHFVFYK